MTETSAIPAAGAVARRPAEEVGILAAGSPWLREPVILTGASKLMTQVWQWTPAMLQQTVGSVRLPATRPGADGKFRYEPGRVPDAQLLSIFQFFADIADPDGPRWCLQQVSVERELPILWARLDYPSCIPSGLITAVNLWLAAMSTVTPLHYDDTHNLFAQVSGTKTFYLLPPENLDALYPGPLNTGAQHVSGIDLFHPDLSRHPLVGSLSCRTATVRAGEALLLPAFWWHQVVSADVSVSVNFWWRAHVLDCLCPGFMRQLQSAAVQQDLNTLARTFEVGSSGADGIAKDASELARLLSEIGEHRAAVSLGLSVLRTLQQRTASAGPAAAVLDKYAELVRLHSRRDALSTTDVAGLTGDLVMIASGEA